MPQSGDGQSQQQGDKAGPGQARNNRAVAKPGGVTLGQLMMKEARNDNIQMVNHARVLSLLAG
jgi:hypothetical protein